MTRTLPQIHYSHPEETDLSNGSTSAVQEGINVSCVAMIDQPIRPTLPEQLPLMDFHEGV